MEGCAIGLKITIWWSIKRHSSKGRLQRWIGMTTASTHIPILSRFREIVVFFMKINEGEKTVELIVWWWIGVLRPEVWSWTAVSSSGQFEFICWDGWNAVLWCALRCLASRRHYCTVHALLWMWEKWERGVGKRRKELSWAKESIRASMERRGEVPEVRADWESRYGRTD